VRAALPWLGALLLVVAAAAGRAHVSARTEFEAGVAAESAGDLPGALAHFQFAMRWYTPGAEAPVAAADALTRLADAAEAKGDRAGALAALRRLRGGIFSTRSFYSPFGERLAAVDARLARLSAAEQIAAGLARGQSVDALEAEHARLLALDPTPTPGWALAATLGFFGWVGGTLGFIFRGLDAGLRLVQPAARRWSLVFAGSFGVWVLGLWYA
jgi:tetratricopeptide (TPR) repeat protein